MHLRPRRQSFLEILFRKDPWIFGFVGVALVVTTLLHYFAPSQIAKVTLMVTDTSMPVDISLNRSPSSTPSVGSATERYVVWMQGHSFYADMAKTILTDPNYTELKETLRPVAFPDKMGIGGRLKSFFFTSSTRLIADPELRRQEQLANYLDKRLSFKKDTSQDATGAILLKATLPTPELAVNLANLAAALAIQSVYRTESETLGKTILQTQSQLNSSQEQYQKLNAELASYRKRNSLVSTQSQASSLIWRTSGIEVELAQAQAEALQNEKKLESLKAELKQYEFQSLSKSNGGADDFNYIERLRSRSDLLRKQRALYLAENYSPQTDEIKEIDQELSAVTRQLRALLAAKSNSSRFTPIFRDKEQLAKEIETLGMENATLKTKIAFLRQTLKKFEKRTAGDLPEHEQKIAELTQQVQLAYEALQPLNKKLSDLNLLKVDLPNRVRVIDRSTIGKLSPQMTLFTKLILVTLIGTVIAVTITMSIEDSMYRRAKKRSLHPLEATDFRKAS